MVIHPAFFGFKIRWHGNMSDESRFVHPTFWNYALNSLELTPQMKDEVEKNLLMKSQPNPYQYDPFEKVVNSVSFLLMINLSFYRSTLMNNDLGLSNVIYTLYRVNLGVLSVEMALTDVQG